MKELMRDGVRIRLGSSADSAARLWLNRATSSAVRAFLMMILIVLPSVILPGIGTDTKQIVALVALFAGGLVLRHLDLEPVQQLALIVVPVLLCALCAALLCLAGRSPAPAAASHSIAR